MRELDELPVQVVRRRVRVLEEEDGAVELDLPRRAHGLHQQPEAASDEGRGHATAVQRSHPRVVGIVRHVADTAGVEHVEEPLRGERRRVGRADAHQAVAVDGRDPRALPERDVQGRQVRVADERLRIVRDQVEVEERDRLGRSETALERLDDVDVGIAEERVQVIGATPRVTGDVVVPIPDAFSELDLEPAPLPPLDTAEHVGPAVVRTRRRSHTDRAAGGQRLSEPRRRDHLQIRTV